MPKPASTPAEPKKAAPTKQATPPQTPMVPVVFEGHTYEIPKMMDEWSIEACDALSRQEFLIVARELLGPEQWETLKAGRKRRDLRQFVKVLAPVIDNDCIA